MPRLPIHLSLGKEHNILTKYLLSARDRKIVNWDYVANIIQFNSMESRKGKDGHITGLRDGVRIRGPYRTPRGKGTKACNKKQALL